MIIVQTWNSAKRYIPFKENYTAGMSIKDFTALPQQIIATSSVPTYRGYVSPHLPYAVSICCYQYGRNSDLKYSKFEGEGGTGSTLPPPVADASYSVMTNGSLIDYFGLSPTGLSQFYGYSCYYGTDKVQGDLYSIFDSKIHRRSGQLAIKGKVGGFSRPVGMTTIDPQSSNIYAWSYELLACKNCYPSSLAEVVPYAETTMPANSAMINVRSGNVLVHDWTLDGPRKSGTGVTYLGNRTFSQGEYDLYVVFTHPTSPMSNLSHQLQTSIPNQLIGFNVIDTTKSYEGRTLAIGTEISTATVSVSSFPE